MKRPYYIADVNRKRVKGTGTFSLDNNALWTARELVKRTGKTALVMREGVIVREINPKSLGEMMNDEIAATERKLARLKAERDRRCPHCWSEAKRQDCSKCTRQMCVDCISDGDMCGLCVDETWSECCTKKEYCEHV